MGEEFFSFVIIPLLIFAARVSEVSINTLRIIYMLGGRRTTATLLGFFEALIWLIAIRQVFQHVDNWPSYLAYPGGFAAGIYVGMIIEDRIAYGKVILRIITSKDVSAFVQFLDSKKIRYTKVNALSAEGPETLVFIVLKREALSELLSQLALVLPAAFYTIESVKKAVDNGVMPVVNDRMRLFTWLRGVMRN